MLGVQQEKRKQERKMWSTEGLGDGKLHTGGPGRTSVKGDF